LENSKSMNRILPKISARKKEKEIFVVPKT
jgi:hypothetical protein